MHSLEQLAHIPVQFLVERGQRLVKAQHRRPVRQGAAQRNPLRLATAQLFRGAVEQICNAKQLGQFLHALGDGRLAKRSQHEREGQLLADKQGREQRAILRYVADPALGRR